MRDLEGKTAFITGGASGIGLAIAHALGGAGMSIMLADIEETALAAAVVDLQDRQIRVASVICDVTRRAAVEAAAVKTIETFGKVHVVCNNAGVGAGGPIDEIAHDEWAWVLEVNLMGVVYGLECFLPRLRAHGEGGYILNTASMAGLISMPTLEPYSATKYAVVALSEGWAAQLEPEGIGVGVLCPGFVRTNIFSSRRNRPDRFGGAVSEGGDFASELVKSGIDPGHVGRRVLEGVQNNERYIFTHPQMRPYVEARFGAIMAAFDVAEASPALRDADV
jgi:NAD(P)-dependent dehydrogenase (short-subunit alcohol dehydrogenase family)